MSKAGNTRVPGKAWHGASLHLVKRAEDISAMNQRMQDFLNNCVRGSNASGVRLTQSIGHASHLPAIIFANAGAALVLSLFLTEASSVWYQLLPVILIWPLLIPPLISWLRLRTHSTSSAVSRWRSRRIVQYSTVLGTVWASMMLAMLMPPSVLLT